MTCREAIKEVFHDDPGVLTTSQVIDRIYEKHPNQPWQRSTISTSLIGLSVNHSSSSHYPYERRRAFLFSLGNGRYRLWSPETDGTWEVASDGVKLVDESEDVLVAEEDAEEADAAAGMRISLERDLEAALMQHLDDLEPGLTLYEDAGTRGHQLDTGIVGRLDLLAKDLNGHFVVIELKVGQADDRVCGQILRYMGWVKREIARGEHVRGIVVAREFNDRAVYAVDAVADVQLKRYDIRFTFAAA